MDDTRCLLSDQDEPERARGHLKENLSGASAPPAEDVNTFPENDAGVGKDLPPPYADNSPRPSQPQAPHWEIPSISEELAREALVEYVASRCCYSGKPAKEMVFSDLHSLNTYRYRLDTFTESRSTEWASEPYHGQVLDGFNGVAAGPWDVSVPIPAMFQDCQRDVRIPHSSSVKGCNQCLSLGKSPCNKCVTSGQIQCSVCTGSGRDHHSDTRCRSCSGSGRIRCNACSGAGSLQCPNCQGKGQLLCFLKLTIKWRNHSNVHVVDKRSGFPLDLLQEAAGEMLFTDMNQRVYPVESFPDGAVNAASKQAVQEHHMQFSTTCRILQQRQTIELIPVTRVHFTWRDKTHIYFVYGAEHNVYAKDYPAKCCCSIS
ncbi:ssu-2 homolog, tandem duplicate 2 [Alosa sapidissima]|uniref:ssu-2 homolog, tandem duplicate 2 n=1 Tax=Alosa sapidissima TaxID=34773 RepID=UPI001C098DA2|nr:ssu-2 homolog, tandem duplicate 2 [Alosa sapidissima]